jgi:hypothetical protein
MATSICRLLVYWVPSVSACIEAHVCTRTIQIYFQHSSENAAMSGVARVVGADEEVRMGLGLMAEDQL